MSVASDFRRAGLGRWLVNGLIETARRSGVERVVLETTAAWDSVRSFYESCGFVVTHLDASPFGDDAWFELVLA